MGMDCQDQVLENNNNWLSFDKNQPLQDDDGSMKRKSVKFTDYDNCKSCEYDGYENEYEYKYDNSNWSPEKSKIRRNEPPEIVLSIKESLHRLRTLLEEKRAWETDVANGNSPVRSLNIPLNFRFKSIVELSQAVRRRSVKDNMTTSPETTIRTESSLSTLHEEEENISMNEVACSNGNGILHHNHIKKSNLNGNGSPSQSPLIHEPEEIQLISALIKEYNQNESELQRAKSDLEKVERRINELKEARTLLEEEKAKLTIANESETERDLGVTSESGNSQFLVEERSKNESELQKAGSQLKKLEEQINTLNEARELLDDEKAKLTKTAVKSETKRDLELSSEGQSSQFSKQVVQVDGPVRKPKKTAWRRIKSTSERIFFGLLESWF